MSSRKVEPLGIEKILRNSSSIAVKPSPTEHVGSPSSTTPSPSSSRPQSSRGRDTAAANATATETSNVAPRTNRFSVSFPVVPSNSASPVRAARSPVREAPSVVPESLALLAGPSDGNFLTAIAAQERRVLELKEELARAEAHLDTLKKQWTQHEALKKSNDTKSVTKLQPVRTSLPATDAEEDGDGSNAWMQQEMERRKALLNSNKSSNRTVFSGSRNTRTLSLLAPIKKESAAAGSMPPPSGRPPRKDSLSQAAQRNQGAPQGQLKRSQSHIVRATTLPDLTVDGSDSLPTSEATETGADKDALLKTGKKVATDLRDGLWNFWEDLRQVTVGEEATKIEPPPRRRSSVQNLRTVTRQRSKSSLNTSSRDPASTSKTTVESRWWPATRTKQSNTPTAALISAPTLADPSFFAEFDSPVVDRETPVKLKKPITPARHDEKSAFEPSPSASSDAEPWDTWDEASPQWSRASSALSEATTNPSTVSNTASPRTSAEMQKAASASSQRSNRTSGVSSKDPIPWPALTSNGLTSLRHPASHLMEEWEQSGMPSPIKEYHGEQS